MQPSPSNSPRRTSPARRFVFAGAGLVCVALGVLGVVLPGLPTTPFLLAASYLFARSSPRLAAWLAGHRWLGPYLRAVHEERAMPRRAKVVTIAVLWATVGLSLWLLHRNGMLGVWVAAALLSVASGVTWFVGWRLRTVSPGGGPVS